MRLEEKIQALPAETHRRDKDIAAEERYGRIEQEVIEFRKAFARLVERALLEARSIDGIKHLLRLEDETAGIAKDLGLNIDSLRASHENKDERYKLARAEKNSVLVDLRNLVIAFRRNLKRTLDQLVELQSQSAISRRLGIAVETIQDIRENPDCFYGVPDIPFQLQMREKSRSRKNFLRFT